LLAGACRQPTQERCWRPPSPTAPTPPRPPFFLRSRARAWL
jgi:hypothetical protein